MRGLLECSSQQHAPHLAELAWREVAFMAGIRAENAVIAAWQKARDEEIRRNPPPAEMSIDEIGRQSRESSRRHEVMLHNARVAGRRAEAAMEETTRTDPIAPRLPLRERWRLQSQSARPEPDAKAARDGVQQRAQAGAKPPTSEAT